MGVDRMGVGYFEGWAIIRNPYTASTAAPRTSLTSNKKAASHFLEKNEQAVLLRKAIASLLRMPENEVSWTAHLAEELGGDSMVFSQLLLDLTRPVTMRSLGFCRKPNMGDLMTNPTIESLFGALWAGGPHESESNVDTVSSEGSSRVPLPEPLGAIGHDPLYHPSVDHVDGYTITQPLPQDPFQRCAFQRGAEFLHELVENAALHYPNTTALRVAGTKLKQDDDHVDGRGGDSDEEDDEDAPAQDCEEKALFASAAKKHRATLLEQLHLSSVDVNRSTSSYDEEKYRHGKTREDRLFDVTYVEMNAIANSLAERLGLVLNMPKTSGSSSSWFSRITGKNSSIEAVAVAEKDENMSSDMTAGQHIVAVMLPRTTVLPYIAQVAAHKASCVVLPLDPLQPTDVIAFPISDANAKIVLTLGDFITKTHPDLPQKVPQEVVFLDIITGKQVFGLSNPGLVRLSDLDLLQSTGAGGGGKNYRECGTSSSLGSYERAAMIIYTSGSTGKSKGCVVSHGSYHRYAVSCQNVIGYQVGEKGPLKKGEVFAQMLSLAFDGSLDSIFSAWLVAAPLIIFTERQVRSGADMVPIAKSEGITAALSIPTLLSTITTDPDRDLPFPLFSKLTVGGERLVFSLVKMWTKDRRRFFRNAYGPTEAAVATTHIQLRYDDLMSASERRSSSSSEEVEIPIGFPTLGTTLAVMNGSEPVPYGVQGELCLAGCQLAKGYLNRVDKTKEVFTYFQSEAAQRCLVEEHTNQRWYRTGDLCMIHPETRAVYYYGRIDTQIKINGQRIELEEVEVALLKWAEQHPRGLNFKKQPVAAKIGETLVACFCVSREDPVFEGVEDGETVFMSQALVTEAKKFLSGILNRAAVPQKFLFISEIPRGATGKVNRKGLKLPGRGNSGTVDGRSSPAKSKQSAPGSRSPMGRKWAIQKRPSESTQNFLSLQFFSLPC